MPLPMARASEQPETTGERVIVALLALAIFGLFAVDLLDGYQRVKASVLFMLGAWAALLVIHEIGHAVVATLLGWRVCRIVIGYGPAVLKFRASGIPVELRLFPAGGYVVPVPRDLERVRI